MANKTLDQFTAATARPDLLSLAFLLDGDLASPSSRQFTLQLLLEAMQEGLTVESMAVSDPTSLSPTRSQAWVVNPTGTGTWAGSDNKIAVYNNTTSAWVYSTPVEGWRVYDKNTNKVYEYSGSAWVVRQASTIGYDNTTSGLTADDVQAAIDEVVDPQRIDVQIAPFGSGSAVTTGNGTEGITIPSTMNGMNIIDALGAVHDKGVTGATDIQIRRRRAGADADVFSTKITIGDEFFARDGVVNTSNDDLATGDILYVDVDAIHSGTAPNGLTVVITAKVP